MGNKFTRENWTITCQVGITLSWKCWCKSFHTPWIDLVQLK